MVKSNKICPIYIWNITSLLEIYVYAKKNNLERQSKLKKVKKL